METSLIGKALNFGFNECGFESRVSKIKFNHSIINVINIWRITLKKKKLFFDLIYSRKTIYFIKILKTLKLINFFFFIKKKKWIEIRSYVTFTFLRPELSLLKFFSTPSKKFWISLRALTFLQRRTGVSTYLVSTSSGLLSASDSLALQKSGLLMSLNSN